MKQEYEKMAGSKETNKASDVTIIGLNDTEKTPTSVKEAATRMLDDLIKPSNPHKVGEFVELMIDAVKESLIEDILAESERLKEEESKDE